MNLPMFVHLFFYVKSIHEHVQIVCFPPLQLKWFFSTDLSISKSFQICCPSKRDLEAVCYPTFILGGGGGRQWNWNCSLKQIFTVNMGSIKPIIFCSLNPYCICWLYKDGFWLASMNKLPNIEIAKGMKEVVFLSIFYSLKLFRGIYPRSPSQGDIPNKYPLYRVYIWLIIFRVLSQG